MNDLEIKLYNTKEYQSIALKNEAELKGNLDSLSDDQREEGSSLTETIFIMINCGIGISVLSISYTLNILGLFYGIISILIFVLISYSTMIIISNKCHKHNTYDFSELVKIYFGPKVHKAFDSLNFIYLFGNLTANQVITVKILGIIIQDIGSYSEQHRQKFPTSDHFEAKIWSNIWVQVFVNYTIAFLIYMPICLFRNLSKIAIISVLKMLFLLYIIVILIIQAPVFLSNWDANIYNPDNEETHLNVFSLSRGFTRELKFFSMIATIMFSLAFQYGIVPVYSSLRKRTEERMNKVASLSMVFVPIIMITLSVFGYLCVPYKTPELIILRNWEGILQSDDLMKIGKLGILVSLLGSYPIQFSGYRISFFQLLIKSSEFTNKQNFLFTFFSMFLTSTLSIIFTSIISYFSLLGGFIAVMYFYIPFGFYLKDIEKLSSFRGILALIVMHAILLIGWMGGLLTLYN